MLIFSVSFQVNQMSPKTQRGVGLNGINSPKLSQGKTDGGFGLKDGTTPRHRLTRMPGKAASWASWPARVEKGPWGAFGPRRVPTPKMPLDQSGDDISLETRRLANPRAPPCFPRCPAH